MVAVMMVGRVVGVMVGEGVVFRVFVVVVVVVVVVVCSRVPSNWATARSSFDLVFLSPPASASCSMYVCGCSRYAINLEKLAVPGVANIVSAARRACNRKL